MVLHLLDSHFILQFPYTDAVVKETLRLHNPAAFTIRIAVEELQVLGKTVPK